MRFKNRQKPHAGRPNGSTDTIFIEMALLMERFCSNQYDIPSLNLKTA